WNSLVVAFWTTVFSVVLGTAAALGIARNRSALARACDVLFMSPLLLPALAFGFAALIFIHKLGFAPSIPFLVLGHIVVCVPFVLRTTIAALSQLDPALLDASYSLGGGPLMTFRRVTLPLIAPGLGAGAFLAFMASFDNVPVSLFLADERTEMLPIHLWQQIETNPDVRTPQSFTSAISIARSQALCPPCRSSRRSASTSASPTRRSTITCRSNARRGAIRVSAAAPERPLTNETPAPRCREAGAIFSAEI